MISIIVTMVLKRQPTKRFIRNAAISIATMATM